MQPKNVFSAMLAEEYILIDISVCNWWNNDYSIHGTYLEIKGNLNRAQYQFYYMGN